MSMHIKCVRLNNSYEDFRSRHSNGACVPCKQWTPLMYSMSLLFALLCKARVCYWLWWDFAWSSVSLEFSISEHLKIAFSLHSSLFIFQNEKKPRKMSIHFDYFAYCCKHCCLFDSFDFFYWYCCRLRLSFDDGVLSPVLRIYGTNAFRASTNVPNSVHPPKQAVRGQRAKKPLFAAYRMEWNFQVDPWEPLFDAHSFAQYVKIRAHRTQHFVYTHTKVQIKAFRLLWRASNIENPLERRKITRINAHNAAQESLLMTLLFSSSGLCAEIHFSGLVCTGKSHTLRKKSTSTVHISICRHT